MKSPTTWFAVLALSLAWLVGPIAGAAPVEAKSHRSGAYGFRTGTCKTASCRAKHPSGRYVHPSTRAKRHR